MRKDVACRPFLKYCGGKTQLLPELRARVPGKYGTYCEPFVGGGALFFALQPRRAVLSDANVELVDAYLAVRDRVSELVEILGDLAGRHSAEQYAAVRRQVPRDLGEAARAARTIYLNKTCFNGLYRVNARGEFNVPMGRQKKPLAPGSICDEANLRACSEVLQRTDVRAADFRQVVMGLRRGDFAYLDPPYQPTSKTSNFTRYTARGFKEADHGALLQALEWCRATGIKFLLSQAGLPATREAYEAAGMRVDVVRAPRRVNSKGSRRGRVDELLITPREGAR